MLLLYMTSTAGGLAIVTKGGGCRICKLLHAVAGSYSSLSAVLTHNYVLYFPCWLTPRNFRCPPLIPGFRIEFATRKKVV